MASSATGRRRDPARALSVGATRATKGRPTWRRVPGRRASPPSATVAAVPAADRIAFATASWSLHATARAAHPERRIRGDAAVRADRHVPLREATHEARLEPHQYDHQHGERQVPHLGDASRSRPAGNAATNDATTKNTSQSRQPGLRYSIRYMHASRALRVPDSPRSRSRTPEQPGTDLRVPGFHPVPEAQARGVQRRPTRLSVARLHYSGCAGVVGGRGTDNSPGAGR